MENELAKQTIQIIDDVGRSLLSMSGEALTVVVCISIGYAVKLTKIRTRYIPAIVLCTGAIFYSFVSSSGDQPPSLSFPIVRQIGIGFVLGVAAWLIHQSVLRKILDSKMFKDDETKTPFPDNAND